MTKEKVTEVLGTAGTTFLNKLKAYTEGDSCKDIAAGAFREVRFREAVEAFAASSMLTLLWFRWGRSLARRRRSCSRLWIAGRSAVLTWARLSAGRRWTS